MRNILMMVDRSCGCGLDPLVFGHECVHVPGFKPGSEVNVRTPKPASTSSKPSWFISSDWNIRFLKDLEFQVYQDFELQASMQAWFPRA